MDFLLIFGGFDPSLFAGVGADIITSYSFGVNPLAIITTNTLQTSDDFRRYELSKLELINEQMEMLINKYQPKIIKAGMIGNIKIAEILLEKVEKYSLKLIIDPVLKATAGSELIDKEGINFLINKLLPASFLWTPNIPEAKSILKSYEEDPKIISKELFIKFKRPVLLKGGHGKDNEDIIDCLFTEQGMMEFNHKRIKNIDSHGSGCRLATAIAANIAKGKSIDVSVKKALKWIEISFLNSYVKGNENILSFGGNINNFTLDY